MAERVRAFIAIKLSPELKSLLTQVGDKLDARIPPRTVRWVKPAAMHITLIFLGDTPIVKLDSIEHAMTAAAADIPPTTFSAIGLGCFPNTRRPRVIWVGVDDPTGNLKQLKLALDRELAPLGFKPEKRSFSPHLTLGRVHKRADRADVQQLGQVIAGATLKELARMTTRHVHLIRSDLRPDGPIYTPLITVPLG